MRWRGCADTGDDHCRLLSKTVSIGRKVPFKVPLPHNGWGARAGENVCWDGERIPLMQRKLIRVRNFNWGHIWGHVKKLNNYHIL